MITSHTPDTLRAFTARVAQAFEEGLVKGPVHLSGGNEQQLLDIFADVGPDDFVASTWRSHWHALLRGVPEEEVFEEILAGRSITLQFPKYRFFSSAIVAGALPIAVGVAMGIKRRGGSERVWAFLGDMASTTGLFHECSVYANANDLPIEFVVEDNDVSVCTPTMAAWNVNCVADDGLYAKYYSYTLSFPHSGGSKRTNF